MIGAAIQNSSPEAIAKIANSHKLKFTLTKGIRGPRLSNGIPHTAVFDVKGNLVFNGHPSNPATEKAIKNALKEATPPNTDSSGNSFFNKPKYLVDERTWTNADGKTLKAAMVSLSGKTGKFRFPNGRMFNYDITKLSEDDQLLIKEKAAPSEEKSDQETEKNRFEF